MLQVLQKQTLLCLRSEERRVGKECIYSGRASQAEDRIRDFHVTGVQTCALPILYTAISKTIFAAGNDDLRPVMSGVYFQFAPTGVIFVATDAHKLVKYSRTDVTSSSEANFIMP